MEDVKIVDTPGTKRRKDKKGDLVADCHSISARWRNHFSQLLNVNEVNDVRQTEIHSVEPIVFGACEAEWR